MGPPSINTLLKINQFLKDKLLMEKDMVLEARNGMMGPFTRENGQIIKHPGKVNLFILMEILMRENGKITRLMEKVSIAILMEQSMMENGLMIISME